MNREIDYVAMGDRIRCARESERLTQEQLAEACSLSAAHIGHIERGTRPPSLEAVVRISKVLHIGIDFLLTETFDTDDTLLRIINDLLRGHGTIKPKSIVSTIRALADKIDER